MLRSRVANVGKMHALKIAAVLSILSLLRRFPALLRISSTAGHVCVIWQFLLAACFPALQRVGDPTRLTLASTLLSLLWSWKTKSTNVLRFVVASGSAPILSEALRGGDVGVRIEGEGNKH